SYVPYCLLNALGRADFNARYHLVELVPYLLLAILLTSRWGVLGAALAWSSRMIVGFPLFIFAVRRIFGLRCQFLETMRAKYFALLLILSPPLIAAITGNVPWVWLLASGAASSMIYLWVVYAKLIREEERAWFRLGAIKVMDRCLRNAT
ncbi:MAG: polysaccharide biosynthesis C-terminal domain-containing protein, partial [Acidobacteriota bacterium]